MQSASKLEVKLPVGIIREGGQFIAYTSALDLSSCGDTLEEAYSRFDEAFKAFVEECFRMGTLDQVLLDCGWKKIPGKKRLVPPQLIDHSLHAVHIPA